MFSRKHDLLCRKRRKAWHTGYSWHSRKAGRAKVGSEANLHLYVPRAVHEPALHLAGHPTTVPVLSPRTADQPVLLQGCFSCPGLRDSLNSLAQDSAAFGEPQLSAAAGEHPWRRAPREGRIGEAILPSEEVAISFSLTSHLCVRRPAAWGLGVAERLLQSHEGELWPRALAG